jgi:hypothetical protein
VVYWNKEAAKDNGWNEDAIDGRRVERRDYRMKEKREKMAMKCDDDEDGEVKIQDKVGEGGGGREVGRSSSLR